MPNQSLNRSGGGQRSFEINVKSRRPVNLVAPPPTPAREAPGNQGWKSNFLAVPDIPDADAGFTLIFSANAFPDHQAVLDWRRPESGGNWYYSSDLDMEGRLFPALFKYLEEAPVQIFAPFKTKA